MDRDVLKLSAVIVTGSITTMLDMTMVNVALAGMTRAFDAPITTVQWVNAAYLLSIAMVIPVTGRLAERFGARTMWLFALTVFMAGSALCGAAWSVGSLITFRAAQGIGGGMIVPLGIMMLAQAAGPERRGRVMAIAAVPTQLAPIVGPLLGGFVVDAAGWRWIFYLNVPVCLLAIFLSLRGIPRGGRREDRRFDLIGLALLSPAIALLVFGLSSTDLLPLAAGAVLLAAFIAYAMRRPALIDVRLFKHRALAAASALNFVSRLSIFGASMLIPLYYQQVRGHDALTAGLLMAPQSIGTLLALPYVGKLTDRIGARPVVLTGIALTTVSAVAYTQVTAHTQPVLLAASLLVWGMGVAAVAVPVTAAAYQGLPPTEIPNATSAITMIQTVGASVGAAVLSAILQSRAADHPDNLALAFADTFWWVLGFTALALIPALLLPLRPPVSQTADAAPVAAGERDVIARYRAAIDAETAAADRERWADGRTFAFERVLAAPPDVVWRHWIDPELLASWWAPPPMTVTESVLEPGGRAVLEYRDAEDRRYRSEGHVYTAEAPEHLVFDLSVLDADGGVSFTGHYDVTFAHVPGGTGLRLDLSITETTVEAAPYIAGIEPGWAQVLDNLATEINERD